jgi:hypothetical protein
VNQCCWALLTFVIDNRPTMMRSANTTPNCLFLLGCAGTTESQ